MVSADKAFYFFEEISRIPRQSGDEKGIADYLEAFARERGLECFRDKLNNVLIKKPATVPSTAAPVILQGHTDMVYVRDSGCSRRYEDGLELVSEGGWLSAKGTTLGADDGVAVAYMLAALDANELEHPALEALFTASEEVGLVGASGFDCSLLSGKALINLDMEKEGLVYTSCAGGSRHDIVVPMERETVEGLNIMTLTVEGLKGGHSGSEIDKGRANAVVIMARLLTSLGDKVRLLSISAEGKSNAICKGCTAIIGAKAADMDAITAAIGACVNAYTAEYEESDTIGIVLVRGEATTAPCYTAESAKRLFGVILLTPNGALEYSLKIPGLVQTSSNIGVLVENKDNVEIQIQSRSMVGSKIVELKQRFAALASLTGCKDLVGSEYPQWEYRENSRLRDIALETYEKLFGVKAERAAVHAGLECGFFSERMPECDMIALGPDVPDVHTTNERVSIDSFRREWTHLTAILSALAKEN